MLSIKLTLILLVFSIGKADEIPPTLEDELNLQRKYYPFGLEDLQAMTWTEPIYNSFSPNYPFLAEITPINEHFQRIGDTFRGYVYTISISQSYYPVYSVMCSYPLDDSAKKVDPDLDFDTLRQYYLDPLKEKLNDLAIKMKALTNLFKTQFPESKDAQAPKKIIKPTKEFKIAEPLSPKANSAFGSKPITITRRPKKVKPSKPPPTTNSNNNVQSNVFQCGGVTCPDESLTCKITEQAIEPSYAEIQETSFCMSSDNNVLLKGESKYPNPNVGSSMSNSKTFTRNEGSNNKGNEIGTNINKVDAGNVNANFESMENEFEKAMEQFNQQMTKAFGPREYKKEYKITM